MSNSKDQQNPDLPMTVYGLEISYFTGKLEAALRYLGLPYTREAAIPAGEAAAAAGAAQIPSLRLADGTWMSDTTVILQWLDARYPDRELIPRDPTLRFLSLLLEDYADEWLWRPAMHYRWDYEESAQLQSRVIAQEGGRGQPYPELLKRYVIRNRQRGLFTRGDGVSRETWDHVESVYLDTLAQFTTILRERPYLLGDRPSLADFGFFGPMFRHFSMDPTSARIMRETAPTVYEWVARVWNVSGDTSGDLCAACPEDWGPILDAIGSAYLPYLAANAAAFGRNARHFDVDIQGAPYRRIRTSVYRVNCLRALREALAMLPESNRDEVCTLLQTHGCLAFLEGSDDFGALPERAADRFSADPKSMTGVSAHDCERFHLLPIRKVYPGR